MNNMMGYTVVPKYSNKMTTYVCFDNDDDETYFLQLCII